MRYAEVVYKKGKSHVTKYMAFHNWYRLTQYCDKIISENCNISIKILSMDKVAFLKICGVKFLVQ